MTRWEDSNNVWRLYENSKMVGAVWHGSKYWLYWHDGMATRAWIRAPDTLLDVDAETMKAWLLSTWRMA